VNLIPSLARHLEIFPFFCIYTIFKRINQSNEIILIKDGEKKEREFFGSSLRPLFCFSYRRRCDGEKKSR
jgi:hypothetical protein